MAKTITALTVVNTVTLYNLVKSGKLRLSFMNRQIIDLNQIKPAVITLTLVSGGIMEVHQLAELVIVEE